MASYRKHSTGWEYRIKYTDPYTAQPKEKSQRGFKTKKEAELAAAEFTRQLSNREVETEYTLEEYLNIWLDEYKDETVKKSTMRQHRQNVKLHILPYFKKLKLSALRPIEYQKFINHLYDQNYSDRTIRIVHSTMSNAIKKALALELIRRDVTIGITLKRNRKQTKVQFMETRHISRFLTCAREYDYIYWIFFKVLIETGMRKGEAAALRWQDIDLKAKKISVKHTLDFHADDDELFTTPKTENSTRTISISQSLANDLSFHLKWQNENKIALKTLYRHDINLVLCRNNGDVMPRSSLFNAFERILKRAEIAKMPIHALRHTAAVLMLEAGADMKYVQEKLGHGSIRVTSDIYSHISDKLEKDNKDKVENYLKDLL